MSTSYGQSRDDHNPGPGEHVRATLSSHWATSQTGWWRVWDPGIGPCGSEKVTKPRMEGGSPAPGPHAWAWHPDGGGYDRVGFEGALNAASQGLLCGAWAIEHLGV